MVQRNQETGWPGQDWTSAEPLWSREHPLFNKLGASVVTVATSFASATVTVPEVGEELRPIVAAFALHFGEQFAKADKISPYVILEMVGRLYWLKGGTPEAWCVYLESIGIKIAAQSRNLFISFLRFICGSHADRSHRFGKLAQALAYWASIVRPTPDGCDPDPEPQDEIWGTSQFTRWALDLRGYTALAEKWREEASVDASAGEPDGEFSENELPIKAEPSLVHDRTAVAAASQFNSESISETRDNLSNVSPLRQQTSLTKAAAHEELTRIVEQLSQEIDSLSAQIVKLKAENARLNAKTHEHGNQAHADSKEYILLPPDLRAKLVKEFHCTFDPCPYPKPDHFDGLTEDWGESNLVNPPFGSFMHNGKMRGPTAWARKALVEYRKRKTIVFLYPIDKWILELLAAGAEVRNLGDIHWLSTKDGQPGPGTGRHVAAFILRSNPNAD
jgi:hypothetical protein